MTAEPGSLGSARPRIAWALGKVESSGKDASVKNFWVWESGTQRNFVLFLTQAACTTIPSQENRPFCNA